MNRTGRRLIIALSLLVFCAIGVLVLLKKGSRGPGPEYETGPKQETRQIQEPPQEQEPPRPEQAPRRQQEPPRIQEPPQTQEQPPQEPPQEQEPHPRVVADIGTLRVQLDDYKSRTGAYPTTAQGLGVLGVAVKDPWGRDYIYDSPSIRMRESYDLFSAGPDRMPNTPDDDWGELSHEEKPTDQ